MTQQKLVCNEFELLLVAPVHANSQSVTVDEFWARSSPVAMLMLPSQLLVQYADELSGLLRGSLC